MTGPPQTIGGWVAWGRLAGCLLLACLPGLVLAQPAQPAQPAQGADALAKAAGNLATQAVPASAADAVAAPAGLVPVGVTGQAPMADAQLKLALDDSRRQQRELVDLRLRLAAAESATGWLPWLFLGLLGLGGLAVWLGLRLRRLQRDQSRRAWAAAEAELHATLMPDGPASGAAPLLSADAPLLSAPALRPTALAAGAAMARTLAPVTKTLSGLSSASQGGVSSAIAADALPRAVSVEELLDLEQQVDFFMVLGQQQAAIDLLLGHVRATGGINALPYLKLLEIYRQQGDEEAYERTRERFNQRFNALAPPWDGELGAGRHLADYPLVVDRLQRAWQQPLRALAELDALLLRRADLEPLDLPAFHDLLTLHALVRDLPASAATLAPPAAPGRAAAPHGAPQAPAASSLADRTMTLLRDPGPARDDAPLDLLLPLDDEPLDVTQPRPRLTEPASARAMLADWMQSRSTVRASELPVNGAWPAEPVLRSQRLDLDLTEHAPAPREFTRPAAFTELGLRRDSRPADLPTFEDSDLLPPSITRR